MAFTSLADSAFDVCFENVLVNSKIRSQQPDKYGFLNKRAEKGSQSHTRHVELDVDIGADAKDWSKIQATEKLKPVEIELRRIEELVAEIVVEMDYLRSREQRLRDTNESTNNRVKWFGFGTISMLCALGAWQIVYLRAYFRYETLGVGSGDHKLTYSPDPSILSKRGYEKCILSNETWPCWVEGSVLHIRRFKTGTARAAHHIVSNTTQRYST